MFGEHHVAENIFYDFDSVSGVLGGVAQGEVDHGVVMCGFDEAKLEGVGLACSGDLRVDLEEVVDFGERHGSLEVRGFVWRAPYSGKYIP